MLCVLKITITCTQIRRIFRYRKLIKPSFFFYNSFRLYFKHIKRGFFFHCLELLKFISQKRTQYVCIIVSCLLGWVKHIDLYSEFTVCIFRTLTNLSNYKMRSRMLGYIWVESQRACFWDNYNFMIKKQALTVILKHVLELYCKEKCPFKRINACIPNNLKTNLLTTFQFLQVFYLLLFSNYRVG